MKNRTITVPKNKKAEIDLDFNNATNEDLIQVSLTELEFKKLQDSKFFTSINDMVNVNIDDYEDENITNRKKLKKIIESNIFNPNFYDNDVLFAVNGIKELFFEALSRKTGVYFFF